MKITVFKVCVLFLFVILIVVSITSGKAIRNSKKERVKATYEELVQTIYGSKNKTTVRTPTTRSVTYKTRSSKREKKKKVIGDLRDLKKIWKPIPTEKPPPTTTTTTTTTPRTTTVREIENFSDLLSFDVTTFKNYEYSHADLARLGLEDDFNKIFNVTPKK